MSNKEVKLLVDAFHDVCEAFRDNYFCIGCPLWQDVCANKKNSEKFQGILQRIEDETASTS